MTVNSSANSVFVIVFAFSDNLSAENSKLSVDCGSRGNQLFRMYAVKPYHSSVL